MCLLANEKKKFCMTSMILLSVKNAPCDPIAQFEFRQHAENINTVKFSENMSTSDQIFYQNIVGLEGSNFV